MMKMMPLTRRRGVVLVSLAAAIAVRSFHGLATSPDSATDGDGADLRTILRDPFRVTEDAGEPDADEPTAEDVQYHRFLLNLDAYDGENDYDAAASLASAPEAASAARAAPTPYTLEDTLAESNVWEYTFALVVYDPQDDQFVGLYNKDHLWKAGNKKLWKTLTSVAYVLRRLFPERFTRDSPEFVFALGSGDYPHVKRDALPYTAGVAPVLMFGSAFRDPDMYRNMIAMPMPAPQHLECFVEWLANEKVCAEWRAKGVGGKRNAGKLEFGEKAKLGWNDLIPQVVWRGTDFSFLPTLQERTSRLKHPDSRRYVREGEKDRRSRAIQALNDKYDTLLPRWKAAALTATAEREAQGTDRPPWADMKFAAYLDKGKSPTLGSAKYRAWEAVGIGVARGMSAVDLARYRYHIDLGGGGGTTWTGTLEKLAMPGLLFHHVTPTKDYFHDRLRAWKHYVPVAPNLRDLQRKFEWAEGHPAQARRIAEAGADFVRRLGTPEGFGEMFREDFVEPLRRTIEAYQPVGATRPGTTWREVLDSLENCRVMPVIECSGRMPKSCKLVGGDDVLAWQKTMHWRGDRRV